MWETLRTAMVPKKTSAYETQTRVIRISIGHSSSAYSLLLVMPSGNVTAAVCDLWANEAVEYHRLFGGSTPAVFAEILSYDVAAMNSAIALGYQREYQAGLVHSDRYRSPQGFILCPDNAWRIGQALVANNASYYARARAAAMTCGELMLGDPQLRFTAFEQESLQGYLKELETLPATEEDFIDLCLARYRKVNGFLPAAYGL